MATTSPNSKTATPKAQLNLTSAGPIFTANDAKASIRWYCDVLGFTVIEEWKADDGSVHGARMQAGQVEFNVGQDDFAKGRDRKKGVGFRIYCKTDQDVDALAESIKKRGGELTSEPENMPWGERVFSVTDLDGFMIAIAGPAGG